MSKEVFKLTFPKTIKTDIIKTLLRQLITELKKKADNKVLLFCTQHTFFFLNYTSLSFHTLPLHRVVICMYLNHTETIYL